MTKEDEQIIDMYWAREQEAITETADKYGKYCGTIAWNILYNSEDCEECLNDTWLKAWNSMPTERPQILSAFLGAITRNLSLDRYRKNHAKKRGEGQVAYIFEELQDCFSSTGPEEELDAKELVNALNDFLGKLDGDNRKIFVRRYWYMDSVEAIAERFQVSAGKVKSSLFRTRNKLRLFLQERGFTV